MSPDKQRHPRRERGQPLVSQRRPRRVNRVYYVVCEGEVTEYEYLTMINSRFGSHWGFWLDFPSQRERRNGLKPRRAVERALRAAQEEQVDEVWALFDRDQHLQIPEAFEAVQGNAKVRIAFSNPSFDLWLLLHFSSTMPRTRGSSDWVHERLGSCPQFDGFGDRDKHITNDRAVVLASNLRVAVRNARALVDACPAGACSARRGHAASCRPLDRDPSTDVYLLIESLGIVPPLR